MRYLYLCTFVTILQASIASADIVNGDFANGDFTGWSTLVSTKARGASIEVAAFPGGNRAVLTADATSTLTATAAIQQAFSISAPQAFALDFASEQSLEGLNPKLAGSSNVSIIISQVGGAWTHDWTYTLYNDPDQSASSLTIPFGTVSTVLPQSGNYLLYAQVQAADGVSGNDSYAQLMLGNVRLQTAQAVPEPAGSVLLLIGSGIAVGCGTWLKRGRRHNGTTAK